MDAMSPVQRRSNQLGDFLKARRAQLTPNEVGLPEAGTHRKVAGLRREEVAQLAAISVDYLTRLEQGRVRASASVLITLCRALRLDDDQQAYLYQLAGQTPQPRRRPVQQARPAMRRLLDQLTGTPAVVLGRRLDILAWNDSATALYTDFARLPARRRNYVRLLFTDPAFRALHANWDHDARIVVASLRMEAAKDPDDPELAVLVGELSLQTPTSAPGGPPTRSPGPASAPSTTGTRWSVTSPSTATPGTARRQRPAPHDPHRRTRHALPRAATHPRLLERQATRRPRRGNSRR